MDSDFAKRVGIGCAGALTPILVNLLIVDLQTQFSSVTLVSALFYGLRVVLLCLAACVVVFLNSDETRAVKLFQLGITAPAFLTGMINGTAVAQKPTPPPAATSSTLLQDLTPLGNVAFYFSFVGEAQAQVSPAPGTVIDCSKPRDPTFGQQALKGFFGVQPDNQWFVVVGSYASEANALADLDSISRKLSGKFTVKLCEPLGGADNYRVVVGEYLTYDVATKMRADAVAAGMPPSAWVWNPVLAKR